MDLQFSTFGWFSLFKTKSLVQKFHLLPYLIVEWNLNFHSWGVLFSLHGIHAVTTAADFETNQSMQTYKSYPHFLYCSMG